MTASSPRPASSDCECPSRGESPHSMDCPAAPDTTGGELREAIERMLVGHMLQPRGSTWYREVADAVLALPALRDLLAERDTLAEVAEERARQDAKWGEQNHPDVDQVLMNRPGGCSPLRMAQEYEIPSAGRAKFITDTAASRGEATWAAIAVEELAEAVEAAALGDELAVRTEVVQLAAVCVQWVQAIDRRALGTPTTDEHICPACRVERADYEGPDGAWLPVCPNCGSTADPVRLGTPTTGGGE